MTRIVVPFVTLVCALAGCATPPPPRHAPIVTPAVAAAPAEEPTAPTAPTKSFDGITDRFSAADAQLSALRKRASWPSVADHERWDAALAAADAARERTAVDPHSLGAFESRVAAVLQMDRIFVVGEMARRQR